MKGIHLIAIAFLASWTIISAENITEKLSTIFEAENECPMVDSCPPKLIRHETDCTKFYECKYRQKQLRSCSAGLYFSKSWRGCVERQFSDCPWFSSTTSTTVIIPTITPTCIHGELLKHECICTQFYECIYGRQVLHDCPTGERFDPQTKTCIPGTNCEDPPSHCAPEGARMPHECQCWKFYVCEYGRKSLRQCQEGLHFDNETLLCIPGENCDKPLPICVNGDTKKHRCNCENYYRCDNNKWVLECCENGEHFSETQKRCMTPCEADCDPKIKEPGYCSSFSPSRWPHECDCRLYYQCVNGKKKIYECTWGYYFDNTNLRCNVAANVKNCVNNWIGCK